MFTELDPNNGLITADNINEPIPSTAERSVGTVVTVSCFEGYTLNGQSTFTCLASGAWSYTEEPTCVGK